MAEALSQNQIDELLSRMRSGETEAVAPEPTQKIKEYDFSSPKKFTKDQLKSLSSLYENYSRVLSSYFTSVLRSSCEVTLSQIEEQRYYEFNNALPDSTLVGIISLTPEDGNFDETTMMLELSTTFGYLIVDRLMGGMGNIVAPDREYTEIEMSLLRMIMGNSTKYLQDVWSGFLQMSAHMHSVETNGRLIQTFSPQDIVVIITFEISDEFYKGTANMCMPTANLEDIIDSFTVKYNHSLKHQDEEREQHKRDRLLDYLKHSEIEIEAHLDDCTMSLGDISQLQVNDVIALKKRIDDDISVRVEGVPWFKARIGEVESKKALKLLKVEANSVE